jgi:hypothetical protein
MGQDTIMAVDPGAGGANKTWNFSGLMAAYTDTIHFLSPAGTPYASMFPNSNVYLTQSGISGGAYMINNSSGLFLDGAGDPTVAIDYNPNEQIIAYPATYLTTFTNTSQFEYKDSTSSNPPADSFLLRSRKIKNSTVDAWGTLMLPSGSFNVIRMRDAEYYRDSVYIHVPIIGWVGVQETRDTNFHYSWWANGQSYPILMVDSSGAGGTGMYYFLKQNTNSVRDINPLTTKMYPNPAKDVVHFTTASTKASISIYDAKGSLVRKVDSSKGDFDVQVSDLNNGLYMYIVTGDDEKTAKGTFQVMH